MLWYYVWANMLYTQKTSWIVNIVLFQIQSKKCDTQQFKKPNFIVEEKMKKSITSKLKWREEDLVKIYSQ